MIVNMSDSATEEQIDHIIQRIREAGFQPHVTRGTSAPSLRQSAAAGAAMKSRRFRSRRAWTTWSPSLSLLSSSVAKPGRRVGGQRWWGKAGGVMIGGRKWS